MLFSHSSFKKKHLLTLPHRVGRRGWRRLLRSCLISWACCNSCYLWLQRSATVWLVIVVRQKSNSTCVSSSFRASQQVHKICKLLFFYPFQMISVQHTSIPSSFALVVNTTATGGRCLTTDLNMGCNELLAQATQTALFSDVLFHFALWMRGWLNERSAWSIWKKMFFQSSSFLLSSWSFFFSQTRQKKQKTVRNILGSCSMRNVWFVFSSCSFHCSLVRRGCGFVREGDVTWFCAPTRIQQYNATVNQTRSSHTHIVR